MRTPRIALAAALATTAVVTGCGHAAPRLTVVVPTPVTALATDPGASVLVTDSNHLWRLNGSSLASITVPPTSDTSCGGVGNISDMAVGPGAEIGLTPLNGDCVFALRDGHLTAQVGTGPTPPYVIGDPRGVTFDATGRLVFSALGLVLIRNSDGSLTPVPSGVSQGVAPQPGGQGFGAGGPMAFDAQGHLWLCDVAWLQEIDPVARHMTVVKVIGGPRNNACTGLGITPSGDVYASTASGTVFRVHEGHVSTYISGHSGGFTALSVGGDGQLYLGDQRALYRVNLSS